VTVFVFALPSYGASRYVTVAFPCCSLFHRQFASGCLFLQVMVCQTSPVHCAWLPSCGVVICTTSSSSSSSVAEASANKACCSHCCC
jgi:hypothetical protein